MKAECWVPTEKIIGFLRPPADQTTNMFFGDVAETAYSQKSLKWKLGTREVPRKTVRL